MKLSEAILKGCEGTVKIKYRFTSSCADHLPENGCCVLGAAVCGVVGLNTTKHLDATWNVWDTIKKNFGLDCEDEVIQEAVKRNNETNESRESIAAWLAEKGY